MRMLLAAAALAFTPAAVLAEEPAPAPAAQATARLNLDTSVADIVADEAGKAVLDAHLPGATEDEHYEMVKGMSLRQIAGMAPKRLPPELLAKVEADLAKIK